MDQTFKIVEIDQLLSYGFIVLTRNPLTGRERLEIENRLNSAMDHFKRAARAKHSIGFIVTDKEDIAPGEPIRLRNHRQYLIFALLRSTPEGTNIDLETAENEIGAMFSGLYGDRPVRIGIVVLNDCGIEIIEAESEPIELPNIPVRKARSRWYDGTLGKDNWLDRFKNE
jgi:hypothetical protein